MRSISLQICAIAGIVVMVNNVWSDRAIETSLVSAGFVALAIYVGLVVFDLTARWVVSSRMLRAGTQEDAGDGAADKEDAAAKNSKAGAAA